MKKRPKRKKSKAVPRKRAPRAIRSYAEFKKKLLAQREIVLKTIRSKQEQQMPAVEVGDEVDQATQSIEKEMLFELGDNERQILEDIEAALRKIAKRTYGICESCRTPILKTRLKAVPFARYCIACQARLERVG
ncbi:MAG: TraR/DksA C4-type zinc finger protein [Elusimicrobia bacterium]|nr:TraR/DksA C4-type zinc finger protein [Elusimicrobiota bacterium]